MHRVNRTIVLNNYHTKEEKGEFKLFYNHQELRTYDDIKNKFKNFKLDEEYVDELKREGCPSITYLNFFLHNKKHIPFLGEAFDIFLFSINFTISSTTDLKYEFIWLSAIEDELREMYDDDVYENYLIKLKYETKFYKLSSLDELTVEEDEDDYDEQPPLKTSYHYDKCVICYEEKPNILNYPCLHLSQCVACNEKGRFIKCIICKEEIQYKIKI